MTKIIILFVLFYSFSAHSLASFEEIKNKVYQDKLTYLPQHAGVDVWDVVSSLIGSENDPNAHGLILRSRITMVDVSDERVPEPKWLHPRGACASVQWLIDEESSATGLFAKGTDVRGIVRVSSGTSDSEYINSTDFSGRIMGMAIKLFPSASPSENVLSRNMITLDQYGFEKSQRKHTFWEDDNKTPVYFTNVAPAKSLLGKFLSSFFDRFDNPNWTRPLYQVAKAKIGGGDFSQFVAPYEIRFQIKREKIKPDLKIYGDFRSELLDLENIEMDIILQSFDGRTQIEKRIGSLRFDKFVVTDYCDLTLHFHHNPIEDQWEKYTNYEAVKNID